MQIVLPSTLKPGDTIGVVAPASAAKRKYCYSGLEYLKNKGFNLKIAPNLTRGKFFLAGPDEKRLKYLQDFLFDPQIKAVFCVRGGYGTIRIVDKLDYEKLSTLPPKVFLGYSDITTLQLAMLAKLGWVTYSGPMVASEMGQNISEFSEYWLWKMVCEHPYPIELKNPEDEPLQVLKEGEAEGPLIGGCLSLITPLLGTPYLPSLKGAILLIEDIGEKNYHLDKHLQILRIHGVFNEIKGLIVGKFTDCFPKNPARSFSLIDYLQAATEGTNFPIIYNFAYGHIKRRFTIPIGVKAKISTCPPSVNLLGL